jgi:hypothetical protein
MKKSPKDTPKKVFQWQLNAIKGSLILPRHNPKDLKDYDNKEHNALYNFMKAKAKELMGLPFDAQIEPIPEQFLADLKNETRKFIQENLPNYAQRLQK